MSDTTNNCKFSQDTVNTIKKSANPYMEFLLQNFTANVLANRKSSISSNNSGISDIHKKDDAIAPIPVKYESDFEDVETPFAGLFD